MAIKYQQRIHEAYAAKIDEKAKAEFDKAREAFPNVPMKFVPSDEATVLCNGNVEICEYFFLKSDIRESFEFAKARPKTVEQAVRANVTAYRAAQDALEVEDSEDYKKIYKALVKSYEDYFALAAESALREAYTDYADFAAEFTSKEEATQAKRIAARKAREAASK